MLAVTDVKFFVPADALEQVVDLGAMPEVALKRSEVRLASFLGQVHEGDEIDECQPLVQVLSRGVNEVVLTLNSSGPGGHLSRLVAKIVRMAGFTRRMPEKTCSTPRAL